VNKYDDDDDDDDDDRVTTDRDRNGFLCIGLDTNEFATKLHQNFPLFLMVVCLGTTL